MRRRRMVRFGCWVTVVRLQGGERGKEGERDKDRIKWEGGGWGKRNGGVGGGRGGTKRRQRRHNAVEDGAIRLPGNGG